MSHLWGKEKVLRYIILVTVIWVGVQACEKRNRYETDLRGTWLGHGYFCMEGTFIDEIVRIDQKGLFVVGVKLEGDDCIPAGDTTFFGEIKNDGSIRGACVGLELTSMKKVKVPCALHETPDGILKLQIEGKTFLWFERISNEVMQ